ncbi:MAG: DUF885 family protein, partial [Rudaea sp.]
MILGIAMMPFFTAAAESPSADERFKAIYTDEWKWRQHEFPGLGSEEEDDADDDASIANDRLAAVDPGAQSARLAYWNDVLKKIDAIPSKDLSPEQRVNYAVFKPQIENLAASIRFRQYEMPFNADSQFWSDLGFMSEKHLKNAKQARDYIARLNDFPRYFGENIVNMRAGLKRGFTVPRAVLDGRDVSISTYINVKSTEDSDFYKPFLALPASISKDEQSALRAECAKAIRERVIPSYSNLLTFFREEYVPHARKTLAAESLPDGKAFYRQQIREYTTLDLDPETIHRTGLNEVARIDAEMRKTIASTGFTGDFAAFQKFLRTDPQFYAKTPDELLMRAAWIAKRV